MLRSAAPRRGSATLDGFNALIAWDANQRRFGPSIDQALQRVFRHDQPSCPSRPPIGSWCAASQHPCYTDRFVDLVGEGFDCAIRVGFLSDSNLIARRIGPIHGKLVASPEYVRENGAPETPDQLLAHQCLVQGTETWHFVDGDKTIALHPQGQFQADNGIALVAAAVAGLGIAALPNFLTEKEIASGALVALMKSYPLPEGGLFIVRPPGHHPARKVRVLTELLIEHFG